MQAGVHGLDKTETSGLAYPRWRDQLLDEAQFLGVVAPLDDAARGVSCVRVSVWHPDVGTTEDSHQLGRCTMLHPLLYVYGVHDVHGCPLAIYP